MVVVRRRVLHTAAKQIFESESHCTAVTAITQPRPAARRRWDSKNLKNPSCIGISDHFTVLRDMCAFKINNTPKTIGRSLSCQYLPHSQPYLQTHRGRLHGPFDHRSTTLAGVFRLIFGTRRDHRAQCITDQADVDDCSGDLR
jgi:hypothetical protein